MYILYKHIYTLTHKRGCASLYLANAMKDVKRGLESLVVICQNIVDDVIRVIMVVAVVQAIDW